MARIYQFPKRTNEGSHEPPPRPRALCEVNGFLASAAVVLRERPDLARSAIVAAGRSPADGARHTTPELVLSRVESSASRASV